MKNTTDKELADDPLALVNRIEREQIALNDAKDRIEIEGMVAKKNHESLRDRDLANEILGRVQASRMIADFVNVISVYQLKEFKERKLYQSLKGKVAYDNDGVEIANVSTWDGFCRAIGISRQKADLDISMLNTFGQEAFDQLNSMGVGYRTLRKLKKLPEEDRETVINGEAINLGDKDQVIELIEDMAAKHHKEKADLRQQNEELRNQREADRRLIQAKDEKINEQDRELSQKLTPEQQKERDKAITDEQVKNLKQHSVDCLRSISQLEAQVEAVYERDSIPEHLQNTVHTELAMVIERVMGMTTDFNIDPGLVINSPEWEAAYKAHRDCDNGIY